MKDLIESYRQQLVAVADKLATEICKTEHGSEALSQLTGALLAVHAKVLEYDALLLGGDPDGSKGAVH